MYKWIRFLIDYFKGLKFILKQPLTINKWMLSTKRILELNSVWKLSLSVSLPLPSGLTVYPAMKGGGGSTSDVASSKVGVYRTLFYLTTGSDDWTKLISLSSSETILVNLLKFWNV